MANQGTSEDAYKYLMEIEVDPALFDEVPSSNEINEIWYIIQYQKTSKKRLIYAAIDKKKLTFTTDNPTTVFFPEGGTGSVVYIAESYQEACQRMQQLKFKCFEKAHLLSPPDSNPNKWLLLQYFSSITEVKYRIIKRMDTVMEEENVFSQTFAYIKEGEKNVFQGMIVRSSYDVRELEKVLEKVRTTYVDCNVFLGMELSRGIACGMNSKILNEDTVNSLRVNALETKMHVESTKIIGALAEVVDLKKRIAERLAGIRKNYPKK